MSPFYFLQLAFSPFLSLSFTFAGSKATERVKWGLSGDCEAYTYLNGDTAATGTGTNESAAETRSVAAVPADADIAAQVRRERFCLFFCSFL